MFKKFNAIADKTERLEIYNLLKVNLAVGLRLSEFMALGLLIAGLGWFMGHYLTAALGAPAGGIAAIWLMMLFVGLFRLPFVSGQAKLAADFGLDPRPPARRFRRLVAIDLRRGLLLGLISTLLFLGLVYLSLPVWIWSALGLGLILTTLAAFRPGLWRPEQLRPLLEGELEAGLVRRIRHWATKAGLSDQAILVSTSFNPELTPPRLEGLGSSLRLIIPEKNLVAFTPRELGVMVVTGLVGPLVKATLKFLLLRLCAVAVAIPLGSILISTLGVRLWGYPLAFSPALITLVWAVAWLAYGAAELASRLTFRNMEAQLAAAAVALLQDEGALPAALATLANKNLEEDRPPAWREFFRGHYSCRVFLRRVRYYQHLAQLEGQDQE